MFDERQLLIVKSDVGINLTNEALEPQLEKLLKIEQYKGFFGGVKREFSSLLDLFAPISDPLSVFKGNEEIELKPHEKAAFFADPSAKALLLELMRIIYRADLPNIIPEALVVSPDDSRLKNFQCSEGSFYTGIVYARHPASPNYFLRFAEFHEKLLEEKRHEFLQLLISLGAKKISWVDKNQQDKSGEASAGLDDPTAITDVGVQISTKQASSSALKIEGEFDLPTYLPKAPKGLKWLNRESSWKTIEHGRTKGNWMKTYKVSFTYAQDFGITSELDIKLKGFGLNIGGNFSSMRTIEQEYEVEFYSRDDYKMIGDTVAISN